MHGNFILNQKRADKICDSIINEGLEFSWGVSSRTKSFPKACWKNEESECWIIYFGLESASQKILNQIEKKISISQMKRTVKTLKDAEIQILGSFILGFPDETLSGSYSNQNWSICYKCSISRSILASNLDSFLKPLFTSVSTISFALALFSRYL